MEATLTDPRMKQDLEALQALPDDRKWSVALHWLTGPNERRRALSTRLFLHMGRSATGLLLDEALSPRRHPELRVRILEIIEHLGLPLEPDQWFTLWGATNRFGSAVRGQILHLLAAHAQAVHQGA